MNNRKMQRAMGNPMTSGPYTGLCRTFRIQVTRRALAQDGSQSLYPWSLGIVNGFAKASSGKVAGSYFEAKGSIQPVSDLMMRFADLEFYRLFRAIHEAIDRFTMLSSMTLIPAGLQRIEMEQAQKKESMHDLLNECLNGRENMIVTKRFGMDGEEKQTLAQLGESLDLSRERIRQIERNALRKMKGKARKLAG